MQPKPVHLDHSALDALRSLPQAIWVFEPTSLQIKWCNPASENLLGFKNNELLGLKITMLRPEAEREALKQAVTRIQEQSFHTSEWTLIRSDKKKIKAQFHWQQCTYQSTPHVMATILDLTERQQNQQLRASSKLAEEELKRVFHAIPGKFMVLKPNTYEIVAASDDYVNSTMTSRQQLIGQGLFAMFPDDPEDPSADGVRTLLASLHRVENLKTTDIMGIQRYAIPTPEGGFEKRHWSVINSPVKNSNNELTYIIHRVEDVTALLDEDPFRQYTDGETGELLQEVLVRFSEVRTTLSKMQEQEILLRSAESMLNILPWEVDLQTTQITWRDGHSEKSPGFETVLKTTRLAEYLNQIHAEDRDEVLKVFNDPTIQDGHRFTFQHRIFREDGSVSQIKGTGEKHNKLGRPTIVGLLQDITEFLFEKKRSSDLEEKLLSTLENMSDAFFIVSSQFDFLYLNLKTERLLKRNREDLLGKNLWHEFPESRNTPIYELYHHAIKKGQAFNVKFFYEPLDTWFEVNGYPVTEGLAVYFKDITNEYRQEAAARLLQERFLLVSKATNDVIWDWDLQTQKVWWNDSITRVFGFNIDDLEPGPESWTNRVHPDDVNRVIESIHDVIEGHESNWTEEYRFRKANGQYAYVNDRGFIIRDESGKSVRMLGSMLDLTEQKELEARLRESQKLEAMGQLTGGVAHDFNNLLTVIMGNAEALSERLSGDKQLKMMAEMTAKAAERGAELTSRLLSFARRQPLKPTSIDVNTLIRDSLELFRQTLSESISIKIVEGKNLDSIHVDAGQLEVALLNLVINARDSMQAGGQLTIATSATTISEQAAAIQDEIQAGNYIKVSVTDTGYGMSKDIMSRAFEPFFTTKDVGKGSGLGLSMVFGFVKQSQGHIRINSEVNVGTTVSLYFPTAQNNKNPENR